MSNSTLPHFERPLLDIVLVDEGEHDGIEINRVRSEDPRLDLDVSSNEL